MNHLLVILFLNELELICLPTSITFVSTQLNGFNYCDLMLIFLFNINCLFADRKKWFQVLLFNTNYSIQHYSFIYIQSNGSKYFYVIPIILCCIQVNVFKYSTQIVYLYTLEWFQVLLYNTNNGNEHQSFVYTQSILFQTIQFNISYLFAHNLNVSSI